MNYSLAKEIYTQPWHVDPLTIISLTTVWDYYKNGGKVSEDDEKNNSMFFYELNSKVISTPYVYDAKYPESIKDQFISIIKLNGPISKGGGMSSYGTTDLASRLKRFDKLENVIGHIVIADSGGGSSSAVKVMKEAINDTKKPLVSLVDGMAASAAYGIISSSDYIYSNDKMNIVGSLGTMIEFGGYPKVSEDKNDGFRYIRVYADESNEKNGEFESAINDLNFEPIKENLLNPVNRVFLDEIKKSRPQITAEQMTGKTFYSGDTIGTLVDEIGTFDDAVNKVIELSNNTNALNTNSNTTQKMNKTELIQKHPELFNTISEEAMNKERMRVTAFTPYIDVDPDAVVKAIESGQEITPNFMVSMARKETAAALKNHMTDDNPEDFETPTEDLKPQEKTNNIQSSTNSILADMGIKNNGGK